MSEENHTAAASHIHVLPMKVLIGTFVALLFLTWATVAVRYIDLGEGNLVLALLIAVVKASLVALFFMHLRYDSLFNGMILCMALLFVALFITISLLDTVQYQGNRIQYQAQQKTTDVPPALEVGEPAPGPVVP